MQFLISEIINQMILNAQLKDLSTVLLMKDTILNRINVRVNAISLIRKRNAMKIVKMP